MGKEKIDLEELAELSRTLFHTYYAGDLEPWFSYLCPESVYLGTVDPMLFGGDAIREHFKDFAGRQVDVIQDEYFPIDLGKQAAQVCGRIVVQGTSGQFRVITHFTMGYRIIGGELKLVHQHNSYEYIQSSGLGEEQALMLDVNTMQFVRDLLLEKPSAKRMAFRSGKQTLLINPYTILYVQSQRKRTEIVCVDRVISCNSPIGELKDRLPGVFYPLHRGYLVNTLYIVAVRRFEAELISGISLPIPELSYTQVKRDLLGMIGK